MNNLLEKMRERGILSLPAPKPAGSYVPTVISGKHLYVSGQLPFMEDGSLGWSGPIDDSKIQYGSEAATRCAMLVIKATLEAVGDVNRITRFVKLSGFVQSPPGFTQQPQVMNGASDLIVSIFGPEVGTHARIAVGVSSLPLNASVEVDAIIEIDGGCCP